MTPASRTRWQMLVRLLSVSLGGYALASLVGAAIAFLLPWCCAWTRADAVLTGSLLGFAFYLAAALWLFNLRRVRVAALVSLAAIGLVYLMPIAQ